MAFTSLNCFKRRFGQHIAPWHSAKGDQGSGAPRSPPDGVESQHGAAQIPKNQPWSSSMIHLVSLHCVRRVRQVGFPSQAHAAPKDTVRRISLFMDRHRPVHAASQAATATGPFSSNRSLSSRENTGAGFGNALPSCSLPHCTSASQLLPCKCSDNQSDDACFCRRPHACPSPGLDGFAALLLFQMSELAGVDSHTSTALLT